MFVTIVETRLSRLIIIDIVLSFVMIIVILSISMTLDFDFLIAA